MIQHMKDWINALPPGKFFLLFVVCIFFQNQPFRKILSGIHVPSVCRADLIQTRPDVLSDLIWVQTVCKGYQQTKLVGNELNGPTHEIMVLIAYFNDFCRLLITVARSGPTVQIWIQTIRHSDSFPERFFFEKKE